MKEIPGDRLFATEAEFIHWLAKLMKAHPAFSRVAVEASIAGTSSSERNLRADIMAVRNASTGPETLIIECKNRPLYGGMVDQALEQIRRYRSMRPGVRLILALPGRLAERDVTRLRTANIELWDLKEIGRIFREQLFDVPSYLAAALSPTLMLETPGELLLHELQACIAGKAQWLIYQKLVGRILEHLFCPPLNVPLSESPDESGVNRRDFILANFAEHGFWNHIRLRYSADYIVVDAKNYVRKVKKRDVLQIANYLRHHGAGLFGIIFSRIGGDNSARITAREQWAHYQKLVLILDDKHCEAMLNASVSGDATSILAKEIQDFRLAM